MDEQLHFQQLNEDTEVDVAIAGGGMAGIVSAYMLAKDGKKNCLAGG
ncbi:hypothetical protein RWE15_01745 [Virgibacillus halophilus]|uniref:Uncharacterized protein n=1 Tax=Tigheibacillus halophilus TaxID=361280 RepID=A0ABU5C245_9BACI|nr:hypothetical protein [Virgibacillus halophilus]